MMLLRPFGVIDSIVRTKERCVVSLIIIVAVIIVAVVIVVVVIVAAASARAIRSPLYLAVGSVHVTIVVIGRRGIGACDPFASLYPAVLSVLPLSVSLVVAASAHVIRSPRCTLRCDWFISWL